MGHRCIMSLSKDNCETDPKADTFGFPKDEALKIKPIVASYWKNCAANEHYQVCFY